MGFTRHSLSPSELGLILEAERHGDPFVAYKEHGDGKLRLEPLADRTLLSIGRAEHNELALTWDGEVSRTHAQLELVGREWTLVDDGLSRNGSFVNGERLAGRRRLIDGDVLRLGRSTLVFRAPATAGDSTVVADAGSLVRLTDAERRVLVALCRPFSSPGSGAIPAGNREIADELNLSLAGVKTHVRSLFAKLEIEDLPQYHKRTELAQRALGSGLVTSRDLIGLDRERGGCAPEDPRGMKSAIPLGGCAWDPSA
jgi:pSer/pThr/pTyr-binding forkhead associated (FHA) protein